MNNYEIHAFFAEIAKRIEYIVLTYFFKKK